MSHINPTLAGRSMRRTYTLAGPARILLPLAATCGADGELTPAWTASSSADRSSIVGPTVNVTTSAVGTSEVTDLSTTSSVAATTAPSVRNAGTTAAAESTSAAKASKPDPILEAELVTQAKLLTRDEYVKLVASLLNDEQRWQALIGYQPRADLTDACVGTRPIIGINKAHHRLTHANHQASHDLASPTERYAVTQYADMVAVLGDSPVGGDQHLRFPGSRKVTELPLTTMQMRGLEVNAFGSWDKTSGTISEIMG
jgi:hypothetical protein